MYKGRVWASSGLGDVVAQTWRAYEAEAAAYAAATRDFNEYPGLRAALIEFAEAMPASLPALDLGCGGGRDSQLLAGLGRSVVAADISMAMLKSGRQQAASPALACVQLNLLDLPFRDGRFGGVWASGSLLHLPSAALPKALDEIWRTLAPGGVIALSMRSGRGEGWRSGGSLAGRRWFTFVDPQDFAALLTRHGFGSVEVNSVGRQQWFIAGGRKR